MNSFLGISWVEWFGYAASVVVAVSLMMSSIVKLRWYNLVGAAMFSAYGFIIGALPVGCLNLFIALADIYYIIQMYRAKDSFKIMNIKDDADYLNYYLDSYSADIKKYFPNFDFSKKNGRSAYYLIKNTVPAGVLVGKKEKDIFVIELDYVSAQYRDFKIGKFLYESNNYFKNLGFKKFVAEAKTEVHSKYLIKMGFVKQGEKYEKNL